MAELLLSPKDPPNAFHPWTNPPTPIPPPPTSGFGGRACRMGLVTTPLPPIPKASAIREISRGKRQDEIEHATTEGFKELQEFFNTKVLTIAETKVQKASANVPQIQRQNSDGTSVQTRPRLTL